MKKYKAIFFDLDHTLWDFELNSHEAIAELYMQHELSNKGINDFTEFIKVYKKVNHEMWDDYHHNRISKEALRFGRFSRALKSFNINDDGLAENLSIQYLEICPVKTNLFPKTLTVLDYLKQHYDLHIITNGFKEVQYLKIRNSGLEKYFSKIHISEEIGFKKPEPEIFLHAVKTAGTIPEKCIMIGDNLDTDINGASNAGIDHVFFNPEGVLFQQSVMKEIRSLDELIQHF